MKLRSIIALLLVLCMAFALVACGETESKKDDEKETVSDTDNDTTEEDEPEIEGGNDEDTKPQIGDYIVYVEDENGDPIEGVKLLFAKDTGDTTITTDEDGKAKLVGLVTDIVVTVEEVPEGYEMDDEEYEFDDDFEITITLKED